MCVHIHNLHFCIDSIPYYKLDFATLIKVSDRTTRLLSQTILYDPANNYRVKNRKNPSAYLNARNAAIHARRIASPQ